MITDLTGATKQSFDVCVLGAGPAGLILALELARESAARSVLLVEYGAAGMSARNGLDDTIRVTNPVNHHEPYECTNKGLGGSSATWGGRCVMYDEVDFIPRKIVGDGCTWNLDLLEEVKPFLAKTSSYFECGQGPFDIKDDPLLSHRRIAAGFTSGEVTDSVVERWSMPTRFGPRYGDEAAQLPNLFLLEGYEARDFSMPDETGEINFLTIRSLTGDGSAEVKARAFVIAAGTQESTRLLLRNPQIFARREDPPSTLGHYYQGHVSGKIASVLFSGDPRKTDYGFIREKDGTYIRRRFQFSTEVLCRENLLNTAIWLDNPLYFDPQHRSGAMSLMYLAMIMPVLGKKLAPPAIAYSVTKGKVVGIRKHLWNLLKDFPGSLVTPALTFYGRYCMQRKLPGVFLYSRENKYALHFHAEQVPVETNRMELDRDGETLVIHYELTDDDIDSVIRCHRLLDEELRRQGCGKLEYWFGDQELPDAIRAMSRDGIHQSGTTRISGDPSSGVLDRDLKVWGTKNLFVCSASAFPTSGQANPTYFLGAFAIRLAHHLNRILYAPS